MSSTPLSSDHICVRYKILERVGKGTYGLVFKAKSIRENCNVALKVVLTDEEFEGFPMSALREIKVLRALSGDSSGSSSSEHIVQLKDVMRMPEIGPFEVDGSADDWDEFRGRTVMVFEFCEYDLVGYMETAKSLVRPPHVKCIFWQILAGLSAVHSRKFLHRDVKTCNILMNNSGIVKIGDFGLCRKASTGWMSPNVVTLWYRSPELLYGAAEYDAAIDMWSAGCILAELLLRKPLFPGNQEIEMLSRMIDLCGVPKYSEEFASHLRKWTILRPKEEKPSRLHSVLHTRGLTDHAIDLLSRLLSYDPKQRPTAVKAMEHPFFKEEPELCLPSQIPVVPSAFTLRIVEAHASFRSKRKKEKEQMGSQPPHLSSSSSSSASRDGGAVNAVSSLESSDIRGRGRGMSLFSPDSKPSSSMGRGWPCGADRSRSLLPVPNPHMMGASEIAGEDSSSASANAAEDDSAGPPRAQIRRKE